MIPLRDSARSGTFPFVTLIIIIVNFLVFFLELSLEEFQLNQFYYIFGVVPAETLNTIFTGAPLEPVIIPFFTAMFIHGGWLHILGNMWYLWIFGDNIEDRLGHFRYLLFYLGVGIVASVVHILANPSSTAPVVGASGALAGVLGAYFVLFPRSRILSLVPIFIFFTVLEVPAIIFIGIWFLIQLFNTLGSLGGAANSVAWWAHLGGFIAGSVMIKFLVRNPRHYNFNGR